MAARDAQRVSAITLQAAEGIGPIVQSSKRVGVLANAPMMLGTAMATSVRSGRVLYLGSLRAEHGVATVLPEVLALLADLPDVQVDIVGDGPDVSSVVRAAQSSPNITFHGPVHDRHELERLLLSSQVGLAIYDPQFPQFQFGDSLKERDYVAAGLRVVSTLPNGLEDKRIRRVRYSAESIVEAVKEALVDQPETQPLGADLDDTAGLIELVEWLKSNGVTET